MKDGEILYESEWTDISIELYSEDTREEWLRSLDAKAGNGRSAGEIVSFLLALASARGSVEADSPGRFAVHELRLHEDRFRQGRAGRI